MLQSSELDPLIIRGSGFRHLVIFGEAYFEDRDVSRQAEELYYRDIFDASILASIMIDLLLQYHGDTVCVLSAP
jgi:hypothetical protein